MPFTITSLIMHDTSQSVSQSVTCWILVKKALQRTEITWVCLLEIKHALHHDLYLFERSFLAKCVISRELFFYCNSLIIIVLIKVKQQKFTKTQGRHRSWLDDVGNEIKAPVATGWVIHLKRVENMGQDFRQLSFQSRLNKYSADNILHTCLSQGC